MSSNFDGRKNSKNMTLNLTTSKTEKLLRYQNYLTNPKEKKSKEPPKTTRPKAVKKGTRNQ